jgi:hypothetical protein
VLLDCPRGNHGIVVADETGIVIGKGEAETNRPHMPWAAINAKDMHVINTKSSRRQNNLDCRDFLHGCAATARPGAPRELDLAAPAASPLT